MKQKGECSLLKKRTKKLFWFLGFGRFSVSGQELVRVLGCCAASLIIYWLLFAFVIDRPLTAGLLNLELQQKTARLESLPSPKLVILAGSNGPYSHSCKVMGEILAQPCENAGIAVGIGLDDVFARDLPLLRAGDIVYMPMELQQYTTTRAQNKTGADAAILLRHDRLLLGSLPPDRFVGALFCCNLADLLESLAEVPAVRAGLFNPGEILLKEYDAEGDRIDNLPDEADPSLLAHAYRTPPNTTAINSGYGTKLVAAFVAQASRRGVIVVGGLPTEFTSAALSQSLIDSIAHIYQSNGGQFVALENQSEYPVEDFFNSEDHLMQPCQFMHSIAVAEILARLLARAPANLDPHLAETALTCPSAQAMSAAR
jgi:hypothetical protein